MKYYIIAKSANGDEEVLDTTHAIERAEKEFAGFAKAMGNECDIIIRNEHGQEVKRHYRV